MPLQQTSLIDQIEMLSTGMIGLRIKVVIVDEFDNIIATRFHRSLMSPNELPEEHMAVVNKNLAEMGMPALSLEDISRLSALCALDKELPGRKLEALRLFGKKQK